MANIRNLEEDNGSVFYPLTHERAVVDSNGVRLHTKLENVDQVINGINASETSNPGTASSYWLDNNGTIGYASSGKGLHRANYVKVVEGYDIELTTTLGTSTANAAFFCDDSNAIIQTISKVDSTTSFSGVVPSGATRIYVNYLSTFEVSILGLLTKVDNIDSVMKDITGQEIPVAFTENTSYWKGDIGSAISSSSASYLKRSISFLSVTPGDRYFIKSKGQGLSDNASYIITNSNDIILVKGIGEKLDYTLVTIPENGARIYFNTNKDNISFFSFRTFGELIGIERQIDEILPRQAEYVDDDSNVIPDKAASNKEFNEFKDGLGPFISGKELSDIPVYEGKSRWDDDGNGYIQQGTSTALYRYEPITVPSGNSVLLRYQQRVSVTYIVCYFTDDNERILGTLNEHDTLVNPPSGTTKMYVNTGTADNNVVHIIFASGMFIDGGEGGASNSVSIYAPSPQLPANNTSGSDFDCENVTAQDFQTAFENLIAELPVYFMTGLITPRIGNIFEKVGTDASGQLSIKSYVFSRRNRYAWKAADRLYAYKNGSTVVYIDSCSPLVGSPIYSNDNRTLSGATISSYNGSTNSFSASNGVTYTRDSASDVAAKVVYTTSPMNEEGNANRTVYSKTDSQLGTGTGTDTTHLSYNSMSYERCESLDYHTEHKGTIVLWGNEHGPSSDCCEPSVILYRMAKDITEGGRNNPLLQYLWKYFKFVFIPAANPYGVNIKSRRNYNDVNINRNYNTPGWYVISDSDKGSYPGDQPETQYIMNTVKFFDASIAIDIHCLSYVAVYSYGDGYYPAGRTHFEGVIPDGADGKYNSRVRETMGELSCNYTSYGNGDYETGSQGPDWLNYENIVGGLIEMTPGEGAASYNGKQHTARIMFIDYTLLLNTLRMWLSGFDPNTNLSKIGIW